MIVSMRLPNFGIYSNILYDLPNANNTVPMFKTVDNLNLINIHI